MTSRDKTNESYRETNIRRENIATICGKTGLEINNTGFWGFGAKNSSPINQYNSHVSPIARNETEKIIGCVSPLAIPDSPSASSNEKIVGASVANVEFVESLLKYTSFDSYHFLEGAANKLNLDKTKTNSTESELTNYLNGLGVNHQKVKAYHLADNMLQFYHTKYYAIHKPSVDIMHLASLRSSLGRLISPITGMTHSISYSSMMYIWLNLLLVDILPCDTIVCTSEAGRKAMQETLGIVSSKLSARLGSESPVFNGRLEVIPLGIDTDYWKSSCNKLHARKLLKMPAKSCVILCAGRLAVHDKMDLSPLLIAVRRLVDLHGRDSFKLVLVGDSPKKQWDYAGRVHQLIHEFGLVDIVSVEPNVSQLAMREYFEAADIFVSLSDGIQETFGLTVIQAMACNIPVVVSDWNGYKDTVVHNETGFRVKTYWAPCDEQISGSAFFRPIDSNQLYLAQTVAVDIDEVVKYLDVLISNPELRHSFGEAGRSRVEKLYSWPKIMQQYMDLWEDSNKIFNNLKKVDILKDNDGGILNPCYFQRFSHYPSKILGSGTLLTLTDVGFELLSNGDILNKFLPCDEMRFIFGPIVFEEIASQMSTQIKIDFEDLIQIISRKTRAHPELITRHIMWLIKYGVFNVSY